RLHVDGIVQIGKNTTQATTLIGTDVNNSVVNVPVQLAGLYVTNGSLSNAWAQYSTAGSSGANTALTMSLTTTAAKMLVPLGTNNGPFTLASSAITLPASTQLLGRYSVNYSYCFNTALAANTTYEAAIYAAGVELANTRIRKSMVAGDECFSKEVIHDFGTSSPQLELRLKSSAAASITIYSPVFSVQYMGPGAP
ncbi:MAG: hypothetical protein RLZZ546_2318, partial [Bacteroidota bacterium]